MKKILVPTDFSECAQSAMQVAKAVAAKSGADLYFLHLEDVAPEVVHVLHHEAARHDAHEGQARYQLQHEVELAEKEGLRAHPIFIPRSQEEDIDDYIKPYEIDFVVMGSHGAKGLREAFIGSNTQHVIRYASVPVLVIKHPDSDFNPKRIIFASTFRDDVTKQLKGVMSFAKLWNAELDIVFINLLSHLIEEHEAEKKMRIQLKEAGISGCTCSVVETNEEEFGIMHFAKSVNVDVIAVASEHHSGLGWLFNSNVAEKLTNHSQIPVLVMNAY